MQELGGIQNSIEGFPSRFAYFKDDEQGQTFGLFQHHFVCGAQHCYPVLGRGAFPRFLDAGSVIEGAQRILCSGVRDSDQHVSGRGVGDVEPAMVRGVDGSAIDQ